MDKKLIIPAIKDSHDRHRELKRLLNKERNKLEALYKKYCFIDEIVNRTVDDIELQKYVADLFKDIGYFVTEPKRNNDFDVVIKKFDCVIGIEVKNGKTVSENDLFQATKYKGRYLSEKNLLVHPITVWNNTKQNLPFDKPRITDAINNDFGITTTKLLLDAYLKVKSGVFSLDKFHNYLLISGLIQFE